MQVMTEDEEKNCKLAQFQCVLENPQLKKKHDIKSIIDNLEDVNCQVSATKYLQSNHVKWIGNTPLHFAAINRNSDVCSMLLDLGADFLMKNNNDSTALHEMLESNKSILEKLTLDDTIVNLILSAHLKHSIFGNPSNKSGLSHFHIACAVNSAELVTGFLQNGVSIDHTVNANCSVFPGFTPLHFAARYCAYAIVEVLLSHGANIHTIDARGMTPLLLSLQSELKIISEINLDEALRDCNEKILKLLLEKESSNDMIIREDWGLSQLHVASTLKDSKIAESLLQKVVNINHSVSIKSQLWPGYTPLHFAALCNVDTVKLLMKKGANISIKGNKGPTPFDICIEIYKTEDIHAILSLHPIWKHIILSNGITKLTDLVFAMRDFDHFHQYSELLCDDLSIEGSLLWPGCTPMHLAVLFSKKLSNDNEKNTDEDVSLQILRKLCEKDPSMLSSQDAHGYTPLHLAFRLNKETVINLLLDLLKSSPVWINLDDEDGLSYVHIASAQNNVVLLKRMLSIGSDVNAVFHGKSLISRTLYPGSTALHFAVVNESVEAVETLMKKNADLYAKDANDMTPVHLLLLNFAAGHLLLPADLRDSVVSGIGFSHLHVACWWDQADIAKRLLNDGASINGIINYKPNVNKGPSGLSFLEKYTGCSPLSIAYEEGSCDTVEMLLERGADIFVQDAKGKPLFYIACEQHSRYLNEFVEAVRRDENLQRRLEAETGIGKLHIACFDLDTENIEELIKEGVNVNERIRFDSPVFQGYTPLHLSFQLSNECYIKQTIDTIELLIKNGADVTLPNAALDTTIHMVYGMFSDSPGMRSCYLNVLLESQRDFSANPVNFGGITHFHIACRIFNTIVVNEFLKNIDIDINRPIDFFHDAWSGDTPLHLAASCLKDPDTASEQLDLVDILLKHGANVHAKNKFGNTPLHNSFYWGNNFGSLDVFERIVSAGADVNAKNLHGHTPLYFYLDSDNVTFEGIKFLLRIGCRLNAFSAFADEGYIGKILGKFQHEVLPQILFAITVNFREEMKSDCIGRSVIHNAVSVAPDKTSAITYATCFDQLSRTDCDVDDQDELGRTALHMATKFYNAEAVSGLLMAGADINITDNNGKTAFFCNVDKCILCETYNEKSTESDEKKCKHLKILEILAIHVKKLQLCALDVTEQNEDFACKFFEKLKQENAPSEIFFEELESIKNTSIRSPSVILGNFLSETGAVADYPRMSLIKRKDVDNFFSSGIIKSFREDFPESAGILQLQYRKARARPQLMESARNALTVLIGFRIPDICSEYILVLLKNSELKSLVVSTSCASSRFM